MEERHTRGARRPFDESCSRDETCHETAVDESLIATHYTSSRHGETRSIIEPKDASRERGSSSLDEPLGDSRMSRRFRSQ